MDDQIARLCEHPAIVDACRRLRQKYDVSEGDAVVAQRALAVFFHLKREDSTRLIILPQIVDWAWHEMIADMASYRSFCDGLFLDHHAISHLTIEPDLVAHHLLDENGEKQIAVFDTSSSRAGHLEHNSIEHHSFEQGAAMVRDCTVLDHCSKSGPHAEGVDQVRGRRKAVRTLVLDDTSFDDQASASQQATEEVGPSQEPRPGVTHTMISHTLIDQVQENRGLDTSDRDARKPVL